MAIFKQIDYCLTKDPGFDNENVILLDVEDEVTIEQMRLLKAEFSTNSSILAASIVDIAPGEPRHSLYSVRPENKADEDPTLIHGYTADFDFFKTFGIELVEGSMPLEELSEENSNAVVINEAAVAEFEIENPIGFRLHRQNADFVVVGVMKDIHTHSMHNNIMPMMVWFGDESRRLIALKLTGEGIAGTVAEIQHEWSQVFPYRTMEYSFLDETMAEAYDDEKRVGTLFGVFTMLAVFVASLGLFGLAAYQAEQRTREIGIRKVLGASITSIVRLLCKESTVLVAVASVVAWPVAYYVVNLWLEEFAYRMNIGWFLFVASGVLALCIAFGTISFQSIRAARSNPIETLKHE
jgi:putative ABC transport system permease protein